MIVALALTSILAGPSQTQQAPPRDAAQATPMGTASLAGTVVETDGKTPVRRARVVVAPDGRAPIGWSTSTDDAGRFEITGLAAGRYTITAMKAAWIDSVFGATSVGGKGTAIQVAEGQHLTTPAIKMARGGVIAGTVVDAAGQPLPGATVSALTTTWSVTTGERTLTARGRTATTDDRGAYRLFGLEPGAYVISASVGSGPPASLTNIVRLSTEDVQRVLLETQSGAPAARPAASAPLHTGGYAPMYAPGVADANAAIPIRVGAGEERDDIDVRVDLVPSANVDATVAIPGAATGFTTQAFLLAAQAGARPSAAMAPGRRDSANHFVWAGVTPGAYVIVAMAAPPGATGNAGSLYATQDLVVSGADASASLTLAPGAIVSGRLMFDTMSPPAPADLAKMQLMLMAAASGPATTVPGVSPAEGGTFKFPSVPPGRFRLFFSNGSTSGRWFLRSATARGRDVLDTPLDIRPGQDVDDFVVTLTDRPSILRGQLRDASGRAAPDYTIIVFSENRADWKPLSLHVQTTRPGTDGQFTIQGLPAGNYLVAALTDVVAGEWNDPQFLEQLVTRARAVKIEDGAETRADFRIGGT